MKYLFFAGGSYISGLEIVTLHLIRKLKEQGNEVKCIVNGWNDGMFIKELKKMGVSSEEVKLGWLYWRKPLWTADTLVHLPGAPHRAAAALADFAAERLSARLSRRRPRPGSAAASR